MDPQLFDDLQRSVKTEGPARAIDRLCETLRQRKDYSNLFYALLMKRRHELGVNPVPTGPSQDLPPEVHAPYEEAIRAAGQEVGQLYLEEANIPHAWVFYRMLGETEPVRQALETFRPADGDDCHPLVDIAYHQGVSPRKGFDLILDRFGICSAITMLGGQEFAHGHEVRDYCIKRVVRALHQELCDRLSVEVGRQEGKKAAARTVTELMAGRDWLFADDFYHVDISHLGAVVQMSIHLPPGEELQMARELCAYGARLSPRFRYESEPPFE